MLEKDELKDPGGRLAPESRGCSFNVGAYMRTKSRIFEKSVFCGRCDKMDWTVSIIQDIPRK